MPGSTQEMNSKHPVSVVDHVWRYVTPCRSACEFTRLATQREVTARVLDLPYSRCRLEYSD